MGHMKDVIPSLLCFHMLFLWCFKGIYFQKFGLTHALYSLNGVKWLMPNDPEYLSTRLSYEAIELSKCIRKEDHHMQTLKYGHYELYATSNFEMTS